MRSGRKVGMPIVGLLAWLYVIILAIPLYFVLVSSFKTNSEIQLQPFALPVSWGFGNFVQAWEFARLGVALVNSSWITIAAELLTLALAVPAAYAIARSSGKFAAVVERIFAVGLLLPVFATLVPTLLLSIALGLFQTQVFYIFFLPSTALPLSVIVLTQFFRAIPLSLEESARMDGAGKLQILALIYLPLVMPGIVTVAILNFLTFWNEYLFALVLLPTQDSARTVQTSLPTLTSTLSTDYGVLLAGALITMVPVFAIYIALQRRVEGALLEGSVKS